MLTHAAWPVCLTVDLRLRLNMVRFLSPSIREGLEMTISCFGLQFSGSIPSSIKFLSKLGQLSGTQPVHFRKEYSQLHDHTEICYLDSNRLTGSLPAEALSNLGLLSKPKSHGIGQQESNPTSQQYSVTLLQAIFSCTTTNWQVLNRPSTLCSLRRGSYFCHDTERYSPRCGRRS